MELRKSINWLYENGGPVIRYLTAVNIADDVPSPEVKKLYKQLINSEMIQSRLVNFKPNTEFTGIHNGDRGAFENTVGKLTQIGIRAGYPEFDRKIKPFRIWLKKSMKKAGDGTFEQFSRIIVATYLSKAGFHGDESVRKVFDDRVNHLYKFCRNNNYDIYEDVLKYSGIPKPFRNRPLVKPEIFCDGNARFPWIHDIYMLTADPTREKGNKKERKIDTIIKFILNRKYQLLPDGYGIVKYGKRYYTMGWDIKLPGYFGFDLSKWESGILVQRLELMAHFKAAVQHQWLKQSLKYLGKFKSERGTYIFPRNYLQERKSGYWVLGANMGLEGNRRTKKAIELESTYWMLRIEKLSGNLT
jgi:hypothetical protein